MKRIWSLLLACCLLLSALMAFSACEDETDDKGSKKTPVTTVSVTEWIDAFDLSDLRSFTVSVTERDAGGTEWEEAVSCTIKYRDGVAAIELSESEGGVTSERETCYSKTKINDLVDLDMDVLEEIAFELEDRADYGYSLFTYSEETKSYHASTGWTPFENERIEIWLEDGNIVKILFEASGEYDGEAVEIYSLTQFTKINKTERITMPTQDAKNMLLAAKDSILSEQTFDLYSSEEYSCSDAEFLRTLHSLLGELNFETMSYYRTNEGGGCSIDFDGTGSSITFLGKTVFDADVYVGIANGRVSYVWIEDAEGDFYVDVFFD